MDNILSQTHDKAMISSEKIQTVTDILVKTYDPQAIYLFGSYAWGHPDEDSDLDFLIVLNNFTKDKYHILLDGYKALSDVGVPKDLLVVKSDDFEIRSQAISSLLYRIKREGKRMYAKS